MEIDMTREEAIKELRGFIGQLTEGCQEVIKVLVPELRESEDERVRKWIYNLIGSLGDPQDEDAEKELEEMQPLALAYLEKQKEQKPAEWSEEDYGWLNEAIMMIQNKDGWIRSDDAPKGVVNWLKTLPERFNLQLKQEWSEEDKRLCNLIARCIALGKKAGLVSDDDDIACLDLLKRKDTSLPEGDRKMIELIISELEQEGKDVNAPNLYKPEIDWLKSLRPRPSWKPSEEQMEALRSAVNKLAKTDVADSVRLSIMYDNLKKLM